MAQQDDGQEKTLDPTPQRLQRARAEGDVPKSSDMHTAMSYLGLLLALSISGSAIAVGVADPIFVFLARPNELIPVVMSPGGSEVVFEIFGAAFLAMSPLLLAPLIGVLLSAIAQRSVVFAPQAITPKLSRINPIQGAKQKFGVGGMVEFLKSFIKLIAIGVILVVIILYHHDGVAGLMQLDARQLPQLLFDEAMLLLVATLCIVGVIAVIDVFWQQHHHMQKLRMSLQEVKDETKDSEGDPHIKSKRRQKAQEIVAGQAIQDVPKADVVIVNPTHYAIALKWSRAPGEAPVCVAKGVDAMAARIREVAEEHNVPIHSDPPTARALHAAVEIGDEIAPEHYQAVAIAIRFADAMRTQAS